MLVKLDDNQSYALYYVSRGLEGIESSCVSDSVSEEGIDALKALELTTTIIKKTNEYVLNKEYSTRPPEELANISDEEKYRRNKKTGEYILKTEKNMKNILNTEIDLTQGVVWCLDNQGKLKALQRETLKSITSITGHTRLTTFQERPYIKQDNTEKPSFARHITVITDTDDYEKIDKSLAYKIMKKIQEELGESLEEGFIVKGYRGFLTPNPSTSHEGKGRLNITKNKEPFFGGDYQHTFFGTGYTNIDLNTLQEERQKLAREGTVKGVKVTKG